MNRKQFDEETVRQIRRTYEKTGRSLADLGEEFGRTRQSIYNIVSGKTYGDVDGPILGEDYESSRRATKYASRLSLKVSDAMLQHLRDLQDTLGEKSLSQTVRQVIDAGIDEMWSRHESSD